jgi:hypothetical protein
MLALVALFAVQVPAGADHETRTDTVGLTALGNSPHLADSLLFQPPVPATELNINTDLAFWDHFAYHGNWNGFRIIDISDPADPQEVIWYDDCNGGQGDIVVWDRTPATAGADLLIRSWDSAAPDPAGATGRDCGGADVAQGFEGLHIFDITDPLAPVLLQSLNMSAGSLPVGFGSHTSTLVPDLENDRVLVYNSASNGGGGIDIVEVPLADPGTSSVLRRELTGRNCHDTQVFLGDVLRVACSGGNGFTMLSLDPADGGSLVNPKQLYSRPVTDVTIGHSTAFTWDGDTFVFGHEPGGGSQAQCQESSLDANRTTYFFDTDTGEQIGRWYLPRDQGPTENCTLHNYMMIPTKNGRDIMVSGNYQAGTWVTDITNPRAPVVLGYSDPPALEPSDLGGAWATYWYNGLLYETEITKGLHIFSANDPSTQTPVTFDHLNPQTQEMRIGSDLSFTSSTTFAHTRTPHVFRGKVSSADGRCLSSRKLVVRKVRSGPDRVVGRPATGPIGGWTLKHNKGGQGRYYATLLAKSFADDLDTIQCGGARTANLRVSR